jgi:hypothetical protein
MTTTPASSSANDDYDSPWKDVLENFFPEFMAFYFPQAHAQIDWSAGYAIENTELRKVVRDAQLGKRFADVLVSVTLLNGQARLIYIHVEVQGERDNAFTLRMFTYNYRLFDRYQCPIISLAVLADDNPHWRPSHFEFEELGCRHSFDFPIVKLLDYADQLAQLEVSDNAFALVTAAHLRTSQTKHNPPARYAAKLALVRLLYQHDWSRQRILDLFAVLDWMMRLPEALEQKLWQDIGEIEGEKQMRYITSVERIGMKRGWIEGNQIGLAEGKLEGKLEGETKLLVRLLTKRFGPLSAATQAQLDNATTDQLEHWADAILDAPTLDAVFAAH